MAQAVLCRHFTVETWVRCHVSDGGSSAATGFLPVPQFHQCCMSIFVLWCITVIRTTKEQVLRTCKQSNARMHIAGTLDRRAGLSTCRYWRCEIRERRLCASAAWRRVASQAIPKLGGTRCLHVDGSKVITLKDEAELLRNLGISTNLRGVTFPKTAVFVLSAPTLWHLSNSLPETEDSLLFPKAGTRLPDQTLSSASIAE
jgi:hypothetical protein